MYSTKKVNTRASFKQARFKTLFFMHKMKQFSSLRLWAQFAEVCVSERSPFAKIIHPPDSCGTSSCWLNSMISAPACCSGPVTLKCAVLSQRKSTDVAHFKGRTLGRLAALMSTRARQSACWYATHVGWMDYTGKEVLTEQLLGWDYRSNWLI